MEKDGVGSVVLDLLHLPLCVRGCAVRPKEDADAVLIGVEIRRLPRAALEPHEQAVREELHSRRRPVWFLAATEQDCRPLHSPGTRGGEGRGGRRGRSWCLLARRLPDTGGAAGLFKSGDSRAK